MLGAIYETCDPKPDIDTLTRFYHTLATGGAVCDCHYVRKSAATQEEWKKSQNDRRQEALRGGRTLE